jgi:stearoyl-CoA desaturase (delta-9 desaturase)
MTRAQKIAVFIGVVAPFLTLVGAIILFWNRGIYWIDMVLLLSFYSLTVIGITVGFHRLFTHKAFEAVRPVRIFLAIAGSMALQGPVIKWCAVHRRHHQQSDRDGDPHSPYAFGDGFWAMVRGMWHSHVGWLFEDEPKDMHRSVGDLMADKDLVFIDRTFFLWFVIGLIIPAIIGWLVMGLLGASEGNGRLSPSGLFTASGAWGALHGLFWGGGARVCLMHHATWSINSVCHIWGTRPYNSNDESRNNVIFGIVSFGEGWHNNHHAFPTSARHGLRWYQLDISWLFILTLKKLGLAWNLRLPSEAAMKAKARKDEPETSSAPESSVAADLGLTPPAGADA